jgi:micrococcal nuclease
MTESENLADHATERCADEVRTLDSKCVEETDRVASHIVEVVRRALVIDMRGQPDVPVVEADHPMTGFDESVDELGRPPQRRRSHTHDEHHWGAVRTTAHLVPQPNAVRVDVPVGQEIPLSRTLTCQTRRRRIHRIIAVAAASCLLAACSGDSEPGSPAPRPTDLPAGDDTTIERHIDGDTIGVQGGVSVRLIGIDTPETMHPSRPVECFGREASRFLAELLPIGTEVRLAYDVERLDDFGRTLAYMYRLSDRLFVNAELVRQGYAQISTFPPNVAHVDEFRALQAEARDEGRGLWSACD